MTALNIEDEYDEYSRKLLEACGNETIRIAMRRAIAAFRKNVDETFSKFPQTLDKRKLARKVKEQSIDRMEELVKQAKDSIEDMKGRCYIARNEHEALRVLDEIVGSGKLVVKSKSITSEEIALNEHLESRGNRVVETDLGEFIVQQLKEKPMHLLAPAVHVPKERVAELFSKLKGRSLEPNIPLLVETARELLREFYFKANIGMSGANLVAAETGTIFIIENEGNARFVTNAPPVHIALIGFEKVVPTLSDAMLVSEVTWRYANYKVPSYVSLISSPSKTGDIEKTTTFGAHGPRELHVIFLDNNRTEMAKDPVYREALFCTKCGSCLYECPIFSITAGSFGHRYLGGIGIIWTALVSGGFEKAAPMAYSCTLCGRCKSHCPMEIDTASIVAKLRAQLISKGLVMPGLLDAAENIGKYGNPYGLAT